MTNNITEEETGMLDVVLIRTPYWKELLYTDIVEFLILTNITCKVTERSRDKFFNDMYVGMLIQMLSRLKGERGYLHWLQ